jgi:hypothetical protein
MYFNGKDTQSSSLGGLITLISAIAILVWMGFTIVGVVNREKYFVDEYMQEIQRFDYSNP